MLSATRLRSAGSIGQLPDGTVLPQTVRAEDERLLRGGLDAIMARYLFVRDWPPSARRTQILGVLVAGRRNALNGITWVSTAPQTIVYTAGAQRIAQAYDYQARLKLREGIALIEETQAAKPAAAPTPTPTTPTGSTETPVFDSEPAPARTPVARGGGGVGTGLMVLLGLMLARR